LRHLRLSMCSHLVLTSIFLQALLLSAAPNYSRSI
jgi:hypothetical protein